MGKRASQAWLVVVGAEVVGAAEVVEAEVVGAEVVGAVEVGAVGGDSSFPRVLFRNGSNRPMEVNTDGLAALSDRTRAPALTFGSMATWVQ